MNKEMALNTQEHAGLTKKIHLDCNSLIYRTILMEL